MKCPKCGSIMTIGAAHSPGDAYQYECHHCGKVVPVPSSNPNIVPDCKKDGE